MKGGRRSRRKSTKNRRRSNKKMMGKGLFGPSKEQCLKYQSGQDSLAKFPPKKARMIRMECKSKHGVDMFN